MLKYTTFVVLLVAVCAKQKRSYYPEIIEEAEVPSSIDDNGTTYQKHKAPATYPVPIDQHPKQPIPTYPRPVAPPAPYPVPVTHTRPTAPATHPKINLPVTYPNPIAPVNYPRIKAPAGSPNPAVLEAYPKFAAPAKTGRKPCKVHQTPVSHAVPIEPANQYNPKPAAPAPYPIPLKPTAYPKPAHPIPRGQVPLGEIPRPVYQRGDAEGKTKNPQIPATYPILHTKPSPAAAKHPVPIPPQYEAPLPVYDTGDSSDGYDATKLENPPKHPVPNTYSTPAIYPVNKEPVTYPKPAVPVTYPAPIPFVSHPKPEEPVQYPVKEEPSPATYPVKEQPSPYPKPIVPASYPAPVPTASHPTPVAPPQYPIKEEPTNNPKPAPAIYPVEEEPIPATFPVKEEPSLYPKPAFPIINPAPSVPHPKPVTPAQYPVKEEPASYPKPAPTAYPVKKEPIPAIYPVREEPSSYPKPSVPATYPAPSVSDPKPVEPTTYPITGEPATYPKPAVPVTYPTYPAIQPKPEFPQYEAPLPVYGTEDSPDGIQEPKTPQEVKPVPSNAAAVPRPVDKPAPALAPPVTHPKPKSPAPLPSAVSHPEPEAPVKYPVKEEPTVYTKPTPATYPITPEPVTYPKPADPVTHPIKKQPTVYSKPTPATYPITAEPVSYPAHPSIQPKPEVPLYEAPLPVYGTEDSPDAIEESNTPREDKPVPRPVGIPVQTPALVPSVSHHKPESPSTYPVKEQQPASYPKPAPTTYLAKEEPVTYPPPPAIHPKPEVPQYEAPLPVYGTDDSPDGIQEPPQTQEDKVVGSQVVTGLRPIPVGLPVSALTPVIIEEESADAEPILPPIISSFSCENRIYGYYADVENECKVYHICTSATDDKGVTKYTRTSFRCAPGSVFFQNTRTCVHQREMTDPCIEAPDSYSVNRDFGNIPEKKSDTLPIFDTNRHHIVKPAFNQQPQPLHDVLPFTPAVNKAKEPLFSSQTFPEQQPEEDFVADY